ncbi:MAG: phosphomannomutase/phosphoglucomutase [Clostridia bacterium]|nr:phosphomannomutase/phosphoglucomutase [Clostridia bacterium]
MMRSDWMKLKSGSDIRGDAMEHDGIQPALTTEVAECVGYAFALWLSAKTGIPAEKLTIAVGHDSRLTGPALKKGLIKGLTAADCDVLDCGLCTTPAMFITTVEPETNCDGAVMITASHHPWYKNGFKLITREGGLEGKDITEILKSAIEVELPHRLVKEVDFLSIYTERLSKMVREMLEDDAKLPLLGLHVVVDAGNGAGGFYAKFLESLGAYVDGSQFLEPDGRFPNHIPNPEDKDAMAAISRAVVENEADLGVIFDADCDRAAIVDGQGRAINRNRLIALISAILLEEKAGATIVTDSVTSSGLAKFITEWGGTHYRFKRGYRNVIDEAVRLNEEGIDCPLAIETSGHAALRENFFLDDGMYLVTRLICEAMNRKREGLTLSSLIDELAEPAESAEIRMNIKDEDFRAAGQSVIETVLNKTLEDPEWHLAPDNREGVRISFSLDGGVDNAWFLLRLSVHDPVMPLNAESDVPGGVKIMMKQLYELLKDNEVLDLAPLKAVTE